MAVYQMVADTRSAKEKKKQQAAWKAQQAAENKKIMSNSGKGRSLYTKLMGVKSNFDLGKDTAGKIVEHYGPSYAKANTSYMNMTPTTPTTSLDELSQALIAANGGSGSGSSAGVSAQPAIDLTPILDSYKQSAEAQKGTLRGSYSSQRSQLLDALKRFQEDTSLARNQQKEAFNANRSDLEEQAYMANRSAMQNAAARGLGGSGLQQLAQLQNQIKSSEGTSELAKSNQTALDALTRALANKDTDITSAVNNLTSEEANKINEIEKNTTNVQENMKYNEAVRLQDAIQSAQQANASIAAQSQSSANQYKDLIDSATSAFEGNQVSALNAIKNAFNSYTGTNKKKLNARNKDVKSAYDTALNNLTQQYAVTGLPIQYLNAYKGQLDDLLNQYYK